MTARDRHPSSGPYRSRRGVVFGVCRGIADYYGLSVFWLRFGVVAVFVLSGFWPIAALYVLAALLMKPEPVVPFESDADEEFYVSFTSSREMGLRRLQRTFERMERRIERMESIVTGKEYDWKRRLDQ